MAFYDIMGASKPIDGVITPLGVWDPDLGVRDPRSGGPRSRIWGSEILDPGVRGPRSRIWGSEILDPGSGVPIWVRGPDLGPGVPMAIPGSEDPPGVQIPRCGGLPLYQPRNTIIPLLHTNAIIPNNVYLCYLAQSIFECISRGTW